MDAIKMMAGEFQAEAATTRRVLERVPADKLGWRPHEKSMTLGQLAIHVASIPGRISKLAQGSEFDVANAKFVPEPPKDIHEVNSTFEQSVREAEGFFSSLTPEAAGATWRLLRNGTEVSSQPRIGV